MIIEKSHPRFAQMCANIWIETAIGNKAARDMRTFSKFTGQILIISALGLIGIQVCLLLRLYILAGLAATVLILAGLLVMFHYHFHPNE